MRHTLKEYLKHYNDVDRIQLVIADHSIVIDTELEGSMFIIRAFEDKKFYFVNHNDGVLVLNIN